MADKFDIYQEVTNRIIEQLDNGIIPWHKPWSGVNFGAYNVVTNKPYSLINQLMLKHSGAYASMKQWNAKGGKIIKGEKSEIVVFWKLLPIEETNKNGEIVKKVIPLLRYYRVFHISQVEGVEIKDKEIIHHNPIEEAEKIIADYDAREINLKIKDEVGNRAYYSPSLDCVVVPVKEQYEDINEYYSTKFHECVHSTGYHTRLNRFEVDAQLAAFGSEDYSKEELIAELGASYLMNQIGIETSDTFKNSTAYIQNWLTALKNDKRLIVSASGKAEKAVKYILGITDEDIESELAMA